MRIFLASGIFPPDSGGPATHLAHLLPELVARGHEVRALASGDAAAAPPPFPLTRIPPGPLPIRRWRYARAYRAGAAWADVVYVTSLGLPQPWSRGRTVLRVPGDRAWERAVNRGLVPPADDIDRFQHTRHGPRVAALKWARTRETRRADRIIVPSRYVREMILGWGVDPRKVHVVYSAVPAPPPQTLDAAQARRDLGWPTVGRYVLTVARLTAWKGVDLLIDAVARVPGVTLVVVGEGPAKAALVAHAAARGTTTQFVGTVTREALPRYLRASDYLALYSGYEGLSHTLLEALHAGTPVIASDRGGNPEVVRHGENGLLVKHPDTAALVAALTHAFSPGTRSALAAGTRDGLERFSWSASAGAIVRQLEEVGGAPCVS